MQTQFSSSDFAPSLRFRRWRETLTDQLGMPLEHAKLGESGFDGTLEVGAIDGLPIMRSSDAGSVRSELTPAALRRVEGPDVLVVGLRFAGSSIVTQDGREARCEAGDLVVYDMRPGTIVSGGGELLTISLPRERLEWMLGPARTYSALAIGSGQASTTLTTAFFAQLMRVHEQLDPSSAARMASIGIDLIVSSIAERLARDVPKSLQGNIVLQRAKAYVEAHLGDPTLDPPQLAAAVGVSLRRLQELFHERGRHIADWIWHRRLETAALRLVDRGQVHLSIGALAYGCGFVSQAHFARRFKERYGTTPSEYRHMAARPEK